jgi:uncharacterized protein
MAYFRLFKTGCSRLFRSRDSKSIPNLLRIVMCATGGSAVMKSQKDDHLSFIAGMGSSQIREVRKWSVTNWKKWRNGNSTYPKPSRGNPETYVRLREQARVQLESRVQRRPIHEVLELKPDFGLYKLPAI